MSAAAVAKSPELPIFKQPDYRRPLHWVFKIGDLKATLDFYEKLFGMKVHRHEEFASGCEATCNGPYGGAWSKTMVGYRGEDTNYALELTYNYGISSYEAGNDYRYIAVRKSALVQGADVQKFGGITRDESGREFVASPDGYKYMLVDAGASTTEPFLFVSVHVANLEQAKTFYMNVLGASVRTGAPGALGTTNSVMLGFGPADGVGIELVELPKGQPLEHKTAPGRFASETEDGAPTAIAERVRAAGAGTILHGPIKLQPHNEEVVIVQDLDGHEYCFVDARGYRNCINVRERADGTVVDWTYRERLLKAAMSGEGAKLEVAKVLAGDYDKAALRAKINEKVTAPVVVFSQTSCPYCKKAKTLLEEVGAKYTVVEVDTLGAEGYAMRAELADMTGRASVPNIFIGGKSVGGFTDGPGLETLNKEGKLAGMLKEVGAL